MWGRNRNRVERTNGKPAPPLVGNLVQPVAKNLERHAMMREWKHGRVDRASVKTRLLKAVNF